MAGKSTYPVLSRIRRNGELYAPGTDRDEIELGEKEATRLRALGCIGEAGDDDGESDFDLKTALSALIADGHDVKSMNMADIGKLLGKNARGVKRAHVDAVITEMEP